MLEWDRLLFLSHVIRFISHDSLIKWVLYFSDSSFAIFYYLIFIQAEPDQDNKDNVPQKNQAGFHSHWIFFNEEKSGHDIPAFDFMTL